LSADCIRIKKDDAPGLAPVIGIAPLKDELEKMRNQRDRNAMRLNCLSLMCADRYKFLRIESRSRAQQAVAEKAD
jgi:hypothetical protein